MTVNVYTAERKAFFPRTTGISKAAATKHKSLCMPNFNNACSHQEIDKKMQNPCPLCHSLCLSPDATEKVSNSEKKCVTAIYVFVICYGCKRNVLSRHKSIVRVADYFLPDNCRRQICFIIPDSDRLFAGNHHFYASVAM